MAFMLASPVLVIDDNAAVLNAMERLLEDLGYTPFPVADRAEALSMMESIDFAAGIIDLRLQRDHGGEVLEALRARRPDLPLVVMSGKVETDQLARLVDQADGYLKKPFGRDQLEEVLKSVLSS